MYFSKNGEELRYQIAYLRDVKRHWADARAEFRTHHGQMHLTKLTVQPDAKIRERPCELD